MDLRAYLPVKGALLAEIKGGPFDKLGIRFDPQAVPEVIVFDGHQYLLRVVQLDPEEDPTNCNYYYDYEGKTA